MAASVLEKSEVLESRQLKQKRLVFSVKIVGNATPASKVLSTDLAGVALLIAEGQTSALPAGVTTVTPVDASGLMSVVLDASAVGVVGKVIEARVANITSTSTAAISLSNGYIVIDVDSAANFSSANAEFNLIITYLSK